MSNDIATLETDGLGTFGQDEELRARARRSVASFAIDVEDCRLMLAMLGL